MPITSLKFTNLGPFEEAEFEFDPQINVFVGPNNTGKSTALVTLAGPLFGKFPFPERLLRGLDKDSRPATNVGIRLKDGSVKNLAAHFYTRDDVREGQVTGLLFDRLFRDDWIDPDIGFHLFVPSIRWNNDYKGTPMAKSRPLLLDYETAEMARADGFLQKLIDFDYRAYRTSDERLHKTIEKVFACASRITGGFPVRFIRIDESANGLFVRVGTPDGEISFNSLSQGTQSLIQWIGRLVLGFGQWYEYPSTYSDKPGILIIDEIDAHLHPSWQRQILKALVEEFPALQIFCSTHSPLMLAGLKAGQIHLLTRNDKGKIVVSRNETDIEGWSADEIMHTYLDVKSTTDLETQSRLDRLDELRAKDRLSRAESTELQALRTRVGDALSKSPTSRQVRAVADSLAQVVDKAVAAAGNGRKAPTAKPARRKSKPTSSKRSRPRAK